MTGSTGAGRGKNIVVFSDGTGQEGGVDANTNVYKLFQMIERRSEHQVSFYDRGLGTTGTRKFLGKTCGYGISYNILECYRFIYDTYNDGDRIFLFGFSRGATTMRSLAGFIDLFGMLPQSRPELIEKAYEIYEIESRQERLRKADAFLQANCSLWCDIHFIGVWDTVAALGVPFTTLSLLLDKMPMFKHQFHDLTLSRRVRHARHALAIDDERKSFLPTLWSSEIQPHQTLKQVWFAGMHTDVGGGYVEQNLSDIPFEWMAREAIREGLRISARHEVESRPSERGVMHDSRKDSRLTRLFSKKARSWDRADAPVVHESVRQRSRHAALGYTPWILDQKRFPGGPPIEEPEHNNAQCVTEALEKLLGFMQTIAPGNIITDMPARIEALRRIRTEVDFELRCAHALCPRGEPEGKLEALDYQARAAKRRDRGAARGRLHEMSHGLVVSIDALVNALGAHEIAWPKVTAIEADIQARAMAMYGEYIDLLMNEGIGRTETEIKVSGQLRGYTIAWSAPERAPPNP